MKKYNIREQKNVIIASLLAVVLIMAVGYAAFATNLNIAGTSSIDTRWDVHIKNNGVVVDNAHTNLATSTRAEKVSELTAELACNLTHPGQSTIDYIITVENTGTFGAKLSSINVQGETNYIGVSTSKSSLTTNKVIAANGGTDTVTVTITYKNVNTPPTGTDTTADIAITLNFVQDDGQGGSGFTGTIYRNNTNLLLNGLTMNGDATVWYPTNDYASASEALADYYVFSSQTYCENDVGEGNCSSGTAALNSGTYTTDASELNKTYYLKHDVEDDIITASYVCFVYDNKEHCMKGGDGGASFAANTQIIQDYQTFYNLPNNANPGCYFGSDDAGCSGGGFDSVSAGSVGYVNITGSSSESCSVSNDGSSSCYEW